ncbi:hypothetical protein U9M48_023636 [Paspalum notatum var. saurae]|uniref:Uncharacterized protein n=1 Tax=Paspalum notatum var. saurae TaxID=547442 RepID=A0AAQ3WVA4_PASNO
MPIDWITGMQPVRLGDISSFIPPHAGPALRAASGEKGEANSCARVQCIILSTFECLEELAWGLAATRRQFLWSVRVGAADWGGANALPEEFMAAAAG